MKNVKDFITYYIYLKGSYDNLITTKPGAVELGATTRDTFCVVEDFDSVGWSEYNNNGVWYTEVVWGSMELGDFTYTYHKSQIDKSVTLYTGFAQWLFSPKERGYKKAKDDYKFVVHDYEGFEEYKVRWREHLSGLEKQSDERNRAEEEMVRKRFKDLSELEFKEVLEIVRGVQEYKGLDSVVGAVDYLFNLMGIKR